MLPYLHGYVAFYGGDYKTVLDELLKANQKVNLFFKRGTENDPFIECHDWSAELVFFNFCRRVREWSPGCAALSFWFPQLCPV
ncbi:MAG: hypothetical protein WAN14_12620 [Candidatus Acidiferrales bacterium]